MIATASPQSSQTQSAPIASQSAPIIDLGRGDDLNPRMSRWLSIGGIIGFLLWGATAPPAAPLHGFMHERGPTQVWCMVFSGMVAAFLVMKWQLLGREQKKLKAMDRDFAPLLASGDLDALNRRAEQSATLLGKRLLHIVGIWTSTESTFQLERNADSDAELYQLAQESSFSLVKVLMWAIPLLGFIGTVIGMGQAVCSFLLPPVPVSPWSLVVIVRLAPPVKLGAGVNLSWSRALLISCTVPMKVMVALLAPLPDEKESPVVLDSVRRPLVALSVT